VWVVFDVAEWYCPVGEGVLSCCCLVVCWYTPLVDVGLYADIHHWVHSYSYAFVGGLCPGMSLIHPLRAYALECLSFTCWGLMPWDALTIQLLRAHALECLSFNARKMVPHAYCICSWCRCIVDVGVSCRCVVIDVEVVIGEMSPKVLLLLL